MNKISFKNLKEKKKILIILVAAAVIFAVTAIIIHHATQLTNESYANCAMGDINGDGYINSYDALLVIQSMSDHDLLFENQMLHADINEDGEVNSSDALILLRYSIGALKSLSVSDNFGQDVVSNSRSAKFENDDVISSVQIMNEWDNGDGTHSYQMSLSVKSANGKSMDYWKAQVYLSSSVELYKSWDCNCRVNSDEISLNGGNVPADSAAVCGFIVKAPRELTIKSIHTEVY